MGGSSSKSVVESLSQQINEISMSIVQDCVSVSEQRQIVTSENAGWSFGSSLKIVQTSTISSECFSNTKKQTELQNRIYQAVQNAAEANGVGVLSAIGASKSVADTKLITMIRNGVTMSNIQRNYNKIQQTQEVVLRNAASGVQIFHSVDISQGAEIFAAATLEAVDAAGVFNALTTSIEQQSKATTENPLDFIVKAIGTAFGAISDSFIAIAMIIVAVIGFIFYVVIRSGGSDDDTEQDEETPETEASSSAEAPPNTESTTSTAPEPAQQPRSIQQSQQ